MKFQTGAQDHDSVGDIQSLNDSEPILEAAQLPTTHGGSFIDTRPLIEDSFDTAQAPEQ
jgi:hypothetical protein